jgi:hypothetical protein
MGARSPSDTQQAARAAAQMPPKGPHLRRLDPRTDRRMKHANKGFDSGNNEDMSEHGMAHDDPASLVEA